MPLASDCKPPASHVGSAETVQRWPQRPLSDSASLADTTLLSSGNEQRCTNPTIRSSPLCHSVLGLEFEIWDLWFPASCAGVIPRLDIAPNTSRALPFSRPSVSRIRELSIIIYDVPRIAGSGRASAVSRAVTIRPSVGPVAPSARSSCRRGTRVRGPRRFPSRWCEARRRR